jgi:hypothetical protein
MIDYRETKAGAVLRVIKPVPGYAVVGDLLTVTKCTSSVGGRCDVLHNDTGVPGWFCWHFGAAYLENTGGDRV